jgi:hypothetical protein
MATERQRQAVLGVIVVVLAFVLYRAVTSRGTPSAAAGAATSSPSSATRATARPGRTPGAPATAPDVHLRALDEERPAPKSGERNLFRFQPKAAPPPPAAPPSVVRNAPSVPAGPPPVPPIPLKFIGIVEAPSRSKRIAALVDSTGQPYHGAEGDVVAGQYRILKIGVESIEMAYLDGRGQQTIRLTGS